MRALEFQHNENDEIARRRGRKEKTAPSLAGIGNSAICITIAMYLPELKVAPNLPVHLLSLSHSSITLLFLLVFLAWAYRWLPFGVLSLCVAHAYTSQKLFSRTVIIWKENLLHDIVIRERVCVALRTVGRCCACTDVWVSVWSCIKFLFFPLLPNRHWCLLTAKSHTSDEKLGFSAGNARKKIVGCWRLGTMREKSLTSFCVSFSERARGHVCRADNEFVWALRAVRDSVWRDARKQHTKTAATKIISHAYRNRYTLKTKLCYWGSKRFISEQN